MADPDIPEFNDEEAPSQVAAPEMPAAIPAGVTQDQYQPPPEKGFWRSYFDHKSGRDQQDQFNERVREFEVSQKLQAAEVASRLSLIAESRATQHENSIVNYMKQLTDVQNQIQAASEDAAKFEAAGGGELSPAVGGLKRQYIQSLMSQQQFLQSRLQEMHHQKEVRFDAAEFLQTLAAPHMGGAQGQKGAPKGGGAPAQTTGVPDVPGLAQLRPETQTTGPTMDAQQAQNNPLAFGLDFIKRHVSPKAVIENGQVVIHGATTDEARQLDRTLQEVKGMMPLPVPAIVVDDEGEQNRAAVREDRQAMAQERQAKSADFEAKNALSTAEPALRDVGVAMAQDQTGATRLSGPGGAAASLVDLVPDPKDPTKTMVQGASQEKAAIALSAAADSAEKNPQAAKLVVRDMGQGIRAYVEDLASHGDVQRRGRTNDFVVNLFGRDPDQAQKVMEAINRISKAAKSKDPLPNLVLPDAGAATFQYSQYGNTAQRAPSEGGERETASGMSGEEVQFRNDTEKLLGFLKGSIDSRLGTLNPLDSRRVIAAFEHPGGYMLSHFKGEGSAKERALKTRLMELINPAQRGQLEDAIRRIP